MAGYENIPWDPIEGWMLADPPAFLLPAPSLFVNNFSQWHPYPSPEGCVAYHPCHRRLSLSLRWLFLCPFYCKKGSFPSDVPIECFLPSQQSQLFILDGTLGCPRAYFCLSGYFFVGQVDCSIWFLFPHWHCAQGHGLKRFMPSVLPISAFLVQRLTRIKKRLGVFIKSYFLRSAYSPGTTSIIGWATKA